MSYIDKKQPCKIPVCWFTLRKGLTGTKAVKNWLESCLPIVNWEE